MTFYVAKLCEGLGLAVILAAFLTAFPHVINGKLLLLGLALFVAGWLVERYRAA